jgi:hypothetical protein
MRWYILTLSYSYLLWALGTPAIAQEYFGIQVLDAQTHRGVPLVKLSAQSEEYYTDSNGFIALNSPGLLNQVLDFTLTSFGYASSISLLQTTPGTTNQVTINRQQLAERMYRVTGTGIYQDSVLLNQAAPIQQPLLNANVRGQDSVQTAIYKGELQWFWGDTLYEVGFGNFRAAGATSQLPGQGGLSPSVGVDLEYYVDTNNSAKQMMPLTQPGPVWFDGVFTIVDNTGQERMLTHYSRRDPNNALGGQVEHGLARFNDSQEIFQRFQVYPLDAPISAVGHAFEVTIGEDDYIYFAESYPNIRVKKNWNDVSDPSKWEAFTPLQQGTRYNAANPPLELDAQGNPVYGWKTNTDPLTTDRLEELVQNGHIDRHKSPYRLKDFESGSDIRLHRSSVFWNDYRNSWVMIGNQFFGESLLGEVWFAESPSPEGPWENAVKVVTHHNDSENYTFYNPKQHPYFNEEGGRFIYFEGTYANTFSGNPTATPLYDYNQMMYRLDLSLIPRLFSIPGDFDQDGYVDGADLAIWQQGYGDVGSEIADADGDGDTDGRDFLIWQRSYTGPSPLGLISEIPEPTCVLLAFMSGGALLSLRMPRKLEVIETQ